MESSRWSEESHCSKAEDGPLSCNHRPQKFGEMFRAIDSHNGTFIVCSALWLAPILPVRPGNLRKVKWVEVDLDHAEWRFVARKTKPEVIVPLSRRALLILRELHKFTGAGQYVFPGARSEKRPMLANAVLAALRT